MFLGCTVLQHTVQIKMLLNCAHAYWHNNIIKMNSMLNIYVIQESDCCPVRRIYHNHTRCSCAICYLDDPLCSTAHVRDHNITRSEHYGTFLEYRIGYQNKHMTTTSQHILRAHSQTCSHEARVPPPSV